MIEGHGDDSYKYGDIKSDFSTNISAHNNYQELMNHLMIRPELFNHYPEPDAYSLAKQIAERHDLDPKCVIVTNGATEAIYLIAQSFHLNSDIHNPTFREYEDACRQFSRLKGEKSDSILWLCNPNNPTGEIFEQSYIERMMGEYRLIVLDQSYEHYTNEYIMTPKQCCNYDNVIQIHSMTKTYGVPGLRLGYITTNEKLAENMREYMRPWSVSSIAIEAGKYLLNHQELACKPDIDEARRLEKNLNSLEGVRVMPSKMNYMLCEIEHSTASELKEYLAKKHKMLIRDASNFRGLKANHFRIASQTPRENDALVSAIDLFLKSRNG